MELSIRVLGTGAGTSSSPEPEIADSPAGKTDSAGRDKKRAMPRDGMTRFPECCVDIYFGWTIVPMRLSCPWLVAWA